MILKGILIGVGKIIPGISGAVIAISLGVYEKVIHILSNIKSITREDFIYLLKLLIGMAISILVFSNIIIYLININRMVTMCFFIGLIIPSIYEIRCDIKKEHKKYIIISFILSILLCSFFINIKLNTDSDLIFVFIGIIESITMIIPGISGTAIFTTLNLYDKYINFIASLTLLNFNISQIACFMLGLIIGTIPTIKFLDYMFLNNKSKMYSIIYGFTLSSLVLMACSAVNNIELINILLSFIFFCIGLKTSKKVNRLTVN